jgi:hypothetical protein
MIEHTDGKQSLGPDSIPNWSEILINEGFSGRYLFPIS